MNIRTVHPRQPEAIWAECPSGDCLAPPTPDCLAASDCLVVPSLDCLVALNCLVVPPPDCIAMPSPDYLVASDCLTDPTPDCLAAPDCLASHVGLSCGDSMPTIDIRSFGFGFGHGPKKYRLSLVEFERGGCTGASPCSRLQTHAGWKEFLSCHAKNEKKPWPVVPCEPFKKRQHRSFALFKLRIHLAP
jgi:hypothetical protein